MNITFERKIEQSQEKIWNKLLNIDFWVSCIDGTELVEKKGENHYAIKTHIKVSFFALDLLGDAQFNILQEGKELELKLIQKSAAVNLDSTTRINLTQVDSNTTIQLNSEVSCSGSMAAMAEGFIKNNFNSIFEKVLTQLS